MGTKRRQNRDHVVRNIHLISQREVERRYNKMLEFVKDIPIKGFNCYICTGPKCGNTVKTIDIDAGTTPMIMPCAVTWCGHDMKSTFYQDIIPQKEPEYEWYRPTLKQCMKMRDKPDSLNHFLQGGLQFRKIIPKEESDG